MCYSLGDKSFAALVREPDPKPAKRKRTKREPFTPGRKAVFIGVTKDGSMFINDDDLPLTRDVARRYKAPGEKIAKYEFVGYVR